MTTRLGKNYRNQRKYFVLSRKDEKQTFAKQPKDVRLAIKQTRVEILSRFKKTNIGHVAPTAPSAAPSLPKPSKTL